MDKSRNGESGCSLKEACQPDKSWTTACSRSAELPVEVSAVLLSFTPDVQVRALPAGTSADDEESESEFTGFGDATGYSPWWGGLLLAAWMAHATGELLCGRRVIELGCGSAAMPSTVASSRGAAVVRATDRSPSNVRAARRVLACNRGVSSPACSAQPFAWEDGVDQSDAGTWDVVLFADVLYIEGMAVVLAGAISRLLRPGGTVLGTIALHRNGSSEIFAEMQRGGFIAQELPLEGPVRAAAASASGRLRAVSRSTPGADFGLEGPSNECKLVRWVRAGTCADTGPDMAEVLRQQVLHQQVLHARREVAQERSACDEWMPTE